LSLPLNRPAVPLEHSPRAVQEARKWAGEVCRDLKRDDLQETTELAITELVTNAVLHADAPLSVKVGGTFDHPRFEVRDGSRTLPRVNPHMTDEDELLSTFGRGLGIVGMCASAWGADVSHGGKTVWFEPTSGLAEEPAEPVFDLPGGGEVGAPTPPPEDFITVVFDDMPIRLLADFRRHYYELRRELRLLALAHEDDYPVAKSLTQLFHRVDVIAEQMSGMDVFEAAMQSGEERADIVLRMPPGSPETMAQLLDLLELADEFCRSQRLLALAATPQQFQLQRWYLSEFGRQARGEPPLAWGGAYTVDTSYKQSAS
jgi:anti-sigma regulatory factor (Ser/Thr protein kinase)